MPKHSIEVEIKSLLGGSEKAEELIAKMLKALGSHSQLNHYFKDGNLQKLYGKMATILSDEDKNKLSDLAKRAKDFSVRSRQADGKLILVVKATIDDTTSSNGTARIEFETLISSSSSVIPAQAGIHSIDDLDKLILDAGFKYQAKWSRERREYKFKGLNVSIDKNAGYGYLAEFEKILDNELDSTKTKQMIRNIMKELNVEELPQDRLQRMFDFYNANWREYYGTNKTFVID